MAFLYSFLSSVLTVVLISLIIWWFWSHHKDEFQDVILNPKQKKDIKEASKKLQELENKMKELDKIEDEYERVVQKAELVDKILKDNLWD